MGYTHLRNAASMDYLLVAIAAFFAGILVQALWRGGRRRRESAQPRDGASRQADAFLRGIKAFERGVATQIARDRRTARLRRLTGQRNRVL